MFLIILTISMIIGLIVLLCRNMSSDNKPLSSSSSNYYIPKCTLESDGNYICEDGVILKSEQENPTITGKKWYHTKIFTPLTKDNCESGKWKEIRAGRCKLIVCGDKTTEVHHICDTNKDPYKLSQQCPVKDGKYSCPDGTRIKKVTRGESNNWRNYNIMYKLTKDN